MLIIFIIWWILSVIAAGLPQEDNETRRVTRFVSAMLIPIWFMARWFVWNRWGTGWTGLPEAATFEQAFWLAIIW
jgi:hypothetical protein